jgi:hypothetical protein
VGIDPYEMCIYFNKSLGAMPTSHLEIYRP